MTLLTFLFGALVGVIAGLLRGMQWERKKAAAAVEKAREEEREAIVSCLRDAACYYREPPDEDYNTALILDDLAGEIERGEHLATPPTEG